jgi:hypothetical protein
MEAKLGRIVDVSTGERVRLPVQTETGILFLQQIYDFCLTSSAVVYNTSEFGFHTRFETNMTEVHAVVFLLTGVETAQEFQ